MLAAADKEKPGGPKAARVRADGDGQGFDADRAFGYLTRICDIGPRISGTQGMERQQQLIAEHFSKLKAQVKFQSFDAPHPQTRQPVRMSNMIVSWDPEAKERVLLACHYDTRPHRRPRSEPATRPRRDVSGGQRRRQRRGPVHGDGAPFAGGSSPTYGVDFVFFDGEELVYGNRDPYFLGAEHFAKEYRDHPPQHKYVCGVLVDMIGGKNLELFQESQQPAIWPRK